MLGVPQGLPAEQESHFILQGFEIRIVRAVVYSHPFNYSCLGVCYVRPRTAFVILYEPPEEGRV